MNVKGTLTKFIKSVSGKVVEHSPEILAGIGAGLWITSTVLAVKATPEALELIERAKEKKQTDSDTKPELTVIETVQVAWKPYALPAATGALGVLCVFGGQSVSARRNAALATAYQLSQTAFSEYKEKVIETIGERKERTVHDNLAKDKIEKNPVSKQEVYFVGDKKVLTYDMQSGRYFMSDRSTIERAQYELNRKMDKGMEMCISLNEFYTEIGLPHIPIGDSIGWSAGKTNSEIEIHFSSHLNEKGEPCMVIEHLIPPDYGFNKLY